MNQLSLLDLLTQQPRALTVSEFTAHLRELLEVEFCDAQIEGEVSNFKRHSSGHWYFTLKDAEAQLRCTAFRNQNVYIRFRPQDGVKVRARGRISIYDQRGEYQLVVSSIEPVGKGALQLAFEQLKLRLYHEGLFNEARKRSLPRLPGTIGIITSPTGAVIQDILRVLGRRNQNVNLLIYPARVQGEAAAREIVAGLEYFNNKNDIDLLIIARGGGAFEDLQPFNEESVARAIFAARVPVISAVGHETDFTIADFVADCRASTPSAAAELASVHRDELSAQIAAAREALRSSFQYRLLRERNRLAELLAERGFDQLPTLIRRRRQQLDSLKYRLATTARLQIRNARAQLATASLRLAGRDVESSLLANRNRLERLTARLQLGWQARLNRAGEELRWNVGKLHALSPLAVLARGYALVFDAQGQLVKNPAQISPGDKVRVRLAGGEMNCIRDLE